MSEPQTAAPTGGAAAASRSGPDARPGAGTRSLRREAFPGYAKVWQGLRGAMLGVGLFSAAVNLLMLTGPIYMLQIYDRVLSSGSVATLLGLFAIVIVLYGFLGIYEFLRRRMLSRAAYRLDDMTGSAAFSTHLDSSRAGAGHPLRDLESVRGFLSGPAILGVFDIPWTPIFMAVVFLIHPFLGVLTLAGAGVVVVLALLNERLSHPHSTRAMGHDSEGRAFAEHSGRNMEAIRALGMQDDIAARWKQLHDRAAGETQAGGDWSEGFASSSRAFRLLLQSALLTAGAYLALNQQITPGMIVATSILAGRALAPVDQVIGQWRGIIRAVDAHRRLKETLPAAPQAPAVRLPAPTGAITLSGVIKFVPGDAPAAQRGRILDRIGFSIEAGEGLGVIGNSAAGKSSLARILVGAWRADAGEVRLDGATMEQWPPTELGRHIGYLSQHVELLPGTIAENIARFRPDAEHEQIFTAARIADVHDMILSLPAGYDTRVGVPDQPLSGGQVQRLGLARALFGAPPILVLDEPDAHLDVVGDNALKYAIQIMRSRGSTVIVMAHRPRLLNELDKVLVLHAGRMVHFGDKAEFFRDAVKPVPSAATKSG